MRGICRARRVGGPCGLDHGRARPPRSSGKLHSDGPQYRAGVHRPGWSAFCPGRWVARQPRGCRLGCRAGWFHRSPEVLRVRHRSRLCSGRMVLSRSPRTARAGSHRQDVAADGDRVRRGQRRGGGARLADSIHVVPARARRGCGWPDHGDDGSGLQPRISVQPERAAALRYRVDPDGAQHCASVFCAWALD